MARPARATKMNHSQFEVVVKCARAQRFFLVGLALAFLTACSGDGEGIQPVADAGQDQQVLQNITVKLTGNGSIESGKADNKNLQYRWSFKTKPPQSEARILPADQRQAEFDADVPGQYEISLVVVNGAIESVPDLAVITVSGVADAPVARAGEDQVVTVCSVVKLEGGGSRITKEKPGQRGISYDWRFLTKPKDSLAEIKDGTKANALFTPDKEGKYEVGLVVYDGQYKSPVDSVAITVRADPLRAISKQDTCLDKHAYEIIRGQLRPSQHALLSAGLSATLKNFDALQGNYVRKGARILEFDCRIERADKKSAEEKLALAKEKYEVNKRLRKLNNISELELTQTRSEYAIGLEEVKRAQAIVSECVIYAPFDGIITEKHVQAHQHVNKGDPLFKLVNTGSLEVEMVISSAWLKKIGQNGKFTITLDEVGSPIDARVDRVVGTIDPVSQTVQVIGKLVNPPKTLLPGMSGQVIFPD